MDSPECFVTAHRKKSYTLQANGSFGQDHDRTIHQVNNTCPLRRLVLGICILGETCLRKKYQLCQRKVRLMNSGAEIGDIELYTTIGY